MDCAISLQGQLSCSSSGRDSIPLVCLGGGTPHKPPVVDHRGFVTHEGTACAAYLVARGVEPSSVLKEASSYDTVGNGFFSCVVHALPAGWRDLHVVTSEFHMQRTRAIFDLIYHLQERSLSPVHSAAPVPSPYLSVDLESLSWSFPHQHFRLTYHAVSDEGIFAPEVLAARVARERDSLRSFLRSAVTQAWPSMAAFHRWLHATHVCYAVGRQHEFGSVPVDDKTLQSY